MAQLVKLLTLDFSSGHGLMVCETEPHVGLCADSIGPAWDSLSPSLSLPHAHMCARTVSHSLSLSLSSFLFLWFWQNITYPHRINVLI